MPVDHDQHAVAANSPQASRAHQQPADDAPLDVQRVLRHLVDVGGVDDVGCTISVSHTPESSRATGPASPAWPPIVALIPVGTRKTTLNFSVLSNGRLRNSKIEGIALGRSLARPAVQFDDAHLAVAAARGSVARADDEPNRRARPPRAAPPPCGRNVPEHRADRSAREYPIRAQTAASRQAPKRETKSSYVKRRRRISSPAVGDRVDRGEIDSIEHVSLDDRIGTDVREHHARADAQPPVEGIFAHHVAGQARAAGQQILKVAVVVVAQNIGLELILEDLGHVVDRGIEYGDRLAAGAEHVDHRSDQIPRLANQGGPRLDEDARARDASASDRRLRPARSTRSGHPTNTRRPD